MSKRKNRNKNSSAPQQNVTKRLNEELKQEGSQVSAEVQLFSLDASAENKPEIKHEAEEKPAAEITDRKSDDKQPEPEQVREYRAAERNTYPEDIPAAQSATDTLTAKMDSAFGGDYEDVSEDNQPEENVGTDEAKAEKRPNKFYLVFAVFIIIMSIIGMYSSVCFIANGVSEIANQTSLKNEIALFIYPVVTVDPPAFADVEELPSSVVVESALWRIILTGDNSNYEKLYNTYMYVPAVDVEFNIRALFGNAVEINHQTVGSASTSFTYNEDTNTYLVPISPRYTAYSPVITDISNVGELYTVRVKYMPPTALAIEGIKLHDEATKVMEYTLSKAKNSMTLHSIKNATNLGDTYEY